MKGTYIQSGKTLNFPNTTDITIASGSVIDFGAGIGIAASDIQAGETGAVTVEGVWEFEKDSSNISLGAVVHYDAVAGKMTVSESQTVEGETVKNTSAGYCVAAAGTTATTVRIKLYG